jgi:hypothetical protein
MHTAEERSESLKESTLSPEEMENKRAEIRARVASARKKQDMDQETARVDQDQADDWFDSLDNDAEQTLDDLYGVADPGPSEAANTVSQVAGVTTSQSETSKSRRNKKKKAANKKKKKQLRDQQENEQTPPELAVKNGKIVPYTADMKVRVYRCVTKPASL